MFIGRDYAFLILVISLGWHWLPLHHCSAQERTFVSHSRLLLGTESNLSASVRIGDLNGDDQLDLAIANGRHWPGQNYVFFNQSNARFNLMRPLGHDLATTYATELADLDGDDDLDIVVGNDMAPNVVFLNDGNGSFARHTQLELISSVRSLTLGDIDRDEDIDILVTCRGRQNYVYLNDGSANFGSWVPFGAANDSTINVVLADINRDGHPDLVLANRDRQQNYVLLNDGRTKFEKRVPFGTGRDETRAVGVADFNGDGYPDLVAANIGQANSIYFGSQQGTFEESVEFGRRDGTSYALAVADMNNDGQPDLVVGNAGQPNAVFFNRDQGTRFEEVRFGGETHATYGVAVGDLDADGFQDIAVANSGAQNSVFLNRAAKDLGGQ